MRILFILLSILQLAACSLHVAPDNAPLTQQERDNIQQWQNSNAEDGVRADSLFTLLDSPQLRTLVDEALSSNPNLQQTALSLQVLEAELCQTKGNQLPQADAELSGGKSEDTDESYTGAFSVSWTLDVWGKLSDTTAAAKMDVREQALLLQAAENELAVEVMDYWLQLVARSHSIGIQAQRVETLRKTENYILSRYRSGLGDLQDLDSARSASASAEVTLVEYQETLQRLQRTLQLLLGKTSPLVVAIPEDYPIVLTPLAEVPQQTLERRPDLQSAYFATRSADLKTSVAYKELLPAINLSAALEDIGDSPASLLLTDPLWSLLGDLTAPLFRGGALKAQAEAAELEAAKTYQAYRQTLLTAIGEVEDGLAYERELSKRITLVTSALKSGRNSLTTYKNSYRAGLVDILDLLTVEKATYDLEAELDDLVYKKLANRIQLGLALGLGVTES
jgi:NodT family efflux transporter outer membrane factor (OMF) lipoprotein